MKFEKPSEVIKQHAAKMQAKRQDVEPEMKYDGIGDIFWIVAILEFLDELWLLNRSK